MRLKSILAASFAALLALTGCSGGNDDMPSRSKDLAALDFPDIDALSEHIADRYNGEASLTEGGELDGEIMVNLESSTFEHSDQMNTFQTLEDIGHGASFDYEWVSVTSDTPTGHWGYRYTPDTVQEVVDESIMPTDIWDAAEDGANFAY